MNFKTIAITAASTAAVTAGIAITASSAQALSLAPGSKLSIGGAEPTGGVVISGSAGNYKFDFLTGGLPGDPGTPGDLAVQFTQGSFIGITEGAGGAKIKDISTSTAGGGYAVAPVNDFISNLVLGGESLSFDLLSLNSFTFDLPNPGGVLNGFSFNGQFRTGSGTILGNGALTAIFSTNTTTGATSWAADLTPVPTPALLPGLIGLGLGVLRKRRAEAKVEAEA